MASRTVSNILTERFLIDLVAIYRISMLMQIPDGHAHPLERTLSLRVMAIEKNEKPELPMRETVYDLDFLGVSGFRMELPNVIEETSLDMDVDDVTLLERSSGISTCSFQNGDASIAVDFREVVRNVVLTKECER
jgi:hypothetical protein